MTPPPRGAKNNKDTSLPRVRRGGGRRAGALEGLFVSNTLQWSAAPGPPRGTATPYTD